MFSKFACEGSIATIASLNLASHCGFHSPMTLPFKCFGGSMGSQGTVLCNAIPGFTLVQQVSHLQGYSLSKERLQGTSAGGLQRKYFPQVSHFNVGSPCYLFVCQF